MRPSVRRFHGVAKRAVDAVGAVAGLVILSPVILVTAVLLWRAHGLPVFYRQQRAGIQGHAITILKLRTMTTHRGSDGALLPDAKRLTPLGSRVRRLSLDELPQLWTVLRGDMSLVGPRPLPLEYIERYTDEQRRRLNVRPGITGWAQINGRNALTWPDKLALDVWYVEHSSTWLDFKILVRTPGAVLRGDGVNAEGHISMPEFFGDR